MIFLRFLFLIRVFIIFPLFHVIHEVCGYFDNDVKVQDNRQVLTRAIRSHRYRKQYRAQMYVSVDLCQAFDEHEKRAVKEYLRTHQCAYNLFLIK